MNVRHDGESVRQIQIDAMRDASCNVDTLRERLP